MKSTLPNPSYAPPGRTELYGYEMEREEAIDLIRYYAERGRVHEAWADARRAIQTHFENRPDDGEWHRRVACGEIVLDGEDAAEFARDAGHEAEMRRQAFEEWMGVLRELLTLRREIPAIAARVERQLAPYERESRVVFNAWMEAAE